MSRCAPHFQGARAVRSGFTLLELCMVLFIIALLAGLTMPSVQTAFTEQDLRQDSHQLALMVRTAMIQAGEQHRPYVIELTSSSMSLHPLGVAAKDTDDDSTGNSMDDNAPSDSIIIQDVSLTQDLDPDNKLQIPDPQKDDSWIDMPATSWVFKPGELCSATHVRLTRGKSWVEMTFTPLTGSVDQEKSYFP